jgi:hypothetical protein
MRGSEEVTGFVGGARGIHGTRALLRLDRVRFVSLWLLSVTVHLGRVIRARQRSFHLVVPEFPNEGL